MNINDKNILYIDTTEFGKVEFILSSQGEKDIKQAFAVKPFESPMILGYLDKFLLTLKVKNKGLRIDNIVIYKGKGSFTGLRIAAAVAEGLSLAWGVPVKYKNMPL